MVGWVRVRWGWVGGGVGGVRGWVGWVGGVGGGGCSAFFGVIDFWVPKPRASGCQR